MKTYRERAAEIAAGLATIPSAGKVHSCSRVGGRDWTTFIKRFADGVLPGGGRVARERYRGWTVSRKSVKEGDGAAHLLETYTLIRICGVHDETESEFAFQESVDDALVYFRDYPELSFGVVTGELQVPVIEEREFGEIVAHVAECDLVVAMYTQDLIGGSP